MAKDDVQPTSWTLRFKQGKHTILLCADPLTPFTSIKKELLTVLRERYPEGLPSSSSPNRIPIPESIHEVILGVPVDVYDLTKGWTEMDTNGGGIMESPKSLGLKDGGAIAFAFIEGEGAESTVEFAVEFSSYDDNYPEGEGDADVKMDESDE